VARMAGTTNNRISQLPRFRRHSICWMGMPPRSQARIAEHVRVAHDAESDRVSERDVRFAFPAASAAAPTAPSPDVQ
jgi:hypothetical protein